MQSIFLLDAVIPGGTKSPILENLFRTGIDAVIPGGTKSPILENLFRTGIKSKIRPCSRKGSNNPIKSLLAKCRKNYDITS